MKKVFNILLVGIVLIPSMFFDNAVVKAKTLADYRKELKALEDQINSAKAQANLTKEQINQISNTIVNNTNTINKLSNDLIELQQQIVNATKEIEKKDKEMKEIINFLQVSKGESAYLEYAFGAKDFTDFIYRMAVSEQLSSYNEELVNQYNKLIEDNKKKKIELANKQEELRGKQLELSANKAKLGEELKANSGTQLSIEEEIRLQKTQIQYYEKLKCGENESTEACINRNQVLPAGTAFFRPIVSGKVTSEFGRRCYNLNGRKVCDLHGGTDLSEKGTVPVYAAAPGKVIGHSYRQSCGGNMVYIIHNINGKKYTTLYAHLRTINVRDKQIVDVNTQIGTMGGNPYTEYWDKCSTGQHLHFTMAYGHYLVDYTRWSTFEDMMFNSRVFVNYPYSGSFNGRYRKY